MSKARDDLIALIADAISDNWESCRICEGDGRMYADGKAHYVSENAPTRPCFNCEGTGKVMAEDIEVAVANAIMAQTPYQFAELAESKPEYRLAVIDFSKDGVVFADDRVWYCVVKMEGV